MEPFALFYLSLSLHTYCILYLERERERTGCHLILFCVEAKKNRKVDCREKPREGEREKKKSRRETHGGITYNTFIHSKHTRKNGDRENIVEKISPGTHTVVHILSFYGSPDTRSGTKWAPQFNYFILRKNLEMMGCGDRRDDTDSSYIYITTSGIPLPFQK